MNKVLIIAFHFPPIKISSGIQRTLKFSKYLLNHGWQACILSAHPRAFPSVSNDQVSEIPKEVVVKYAQAWDTAIHLAVKGRYLRWMALPDRWVSWIFAGTLSGLQIIYKYRPKIIFSTYPIATAHLIGLCLHRLTGLPWVADFRDSMTEEDYPVDPMQRKAYRWIERQAIKYSTFSVFTTPGAIRMYGDRYPNCKDKFRLIENGYDEENFIKAENSGQLQEILKIKNPEQLVLLHSGVLYPSERDPRSFFQALAELKKSGQVSTNTLKIVLRATGHDAFYELMLKEIGIDDLVYLMPNISYENALAEMLAVDGLLIFQASNCNHQIPAKIYEYLRARKPVFALTDANGDTAEVLRKAGIPDVTSIDDKHAITENLGLFLRQVSNKKTNSICKEVSVYSRQAKSKQLAQLLNEILVTNY